MPLVRIFKKALGLISYVASSDRLEEPAARPNQSSRGRARTWLRWMTESEALPEEEVPADARAATRGAWFLRSDSFPPDLPTPEKAPGFWSWLIRQDPDLESSPERDER